MATIDLDDPACLDRMSVGGKACGLAAMIRDGIPVAPGFVVSTAAYRDYLARTGLGERLAPVLDGLRDQPFDVIEGAAADIAGWFAATALPAGILEAVAAHYARLSGRLAVARATVAVRSSAVAEDSGGASFAGEYETFVGLSGVADIELHIRRCWASAFTARALTYAWKLGLSPRDVDMAVVVQKAVDARAAGVMFTLSPLTGDRSRIVIEASWGLGLSIVGGEVTPDRWTVAKIEGRILDRVPGRKHIEYLDGSAATAVSEERQQVLCLSDEEVLALARIGKRLEKLQRCPQDIEFAVDRGLPAGENLILLQCRPETVWSARHGSAKPADSVARLAGAVFGGTASRDRQVPGDAASPKR